MIRKNQVKYNMVNVMAFDNTDLFYGLSTGNPVAFMALGFALVTLGLIVVLLVILWKAPKLSKVLFMNNLFDPKEVIVECYDNNKMDFVPVKCFRNGVKKDRAGAWFLSPKSWFHKGGAELSKEERDLVVNTNYTMHGAPGNVSLNYSLSSQIFNPKLAAWIQNNRILEKLKNGSIRPKFSINDFIGALQELKKEGEEFVELNVINLNLPIDIKGFSAEIGQKSYNKSQLTELELQVKNTVLMGRQSQGNQNFGNLGLVLILVVITLLISAGCLLKLLGVF
jgi:hypothetical protein